MLYQYPEAKKQVNFVTFQMVRVQKKKKKTRPLRVVEVGGRLLKGIMRGQGRREGEKKDSVAMDGVKQSDGQWKCRDTERCTSHTDHTKSFPPYLFKIVYVRLPFVRRAMN